ncbi:MAG: hypothetical protein AAFX06_27570 [Planctomycetota bacterium]
MAILAERKLGIASSDESWSRLRELFICCSEAPDASAALCWHGAAALLSEHDGDLERALRHRQTEIERILWLHAEEARNPTDGFQIQDYEGPELQFRREIVAELEHKMNRGG